MFIAVQHGGGETQVGMLTDEQKLYLEGFIRAVAARGVMPIAAVPAAKASDAGSHLDPIHRDAQERFVAAGKKLTPEEEAKREKHPFDMWDEMRGQRRGRALSQGHSTSSATNSTASSTSRRPRMPSCCRLRLPGGIVLGASGRGPRRCRRALRRRLRRHHHPRQSADPRDRRAHPIEVLTAIDELGLTSRGSGADNIRNLTGSPTAGIDPQELIDTRPLTRALYHHILNHRELYGLPRKFNIAFDGGGRLGVSRTPTTSASTAVRVGAGQAGSGGRLFPHGARRDHRARQLRRDTGVLLTPARCVAAAAAVCASSSLMATAPTGARRGSNT